MISPHITNNKIFSLIKIKKTRIIFFPVAAHAFSSKWIVSHKLDDRIHSSVSVHLCCVCHIINSRRFLIELKKKINKKNKIKMGWSSILFISYWNSYLLNLYLNIICRFITNDTKNNIIKFCRYTYINYRVPSSPVSLIFI